MSAAIVRINLLPHREQKRAGAAAAVHLAGDRPRDPRPRLRRPGATCILPASIDNQNSRNGLLKTEIAKLDEQIKEIDKLREQTQALLARKQVVETLQTNRTEAVHLLDQLVRQLPDGIYLRSVQAAGHAVTLIGYAQSNARVSTLMRNIESSPWLANRSWSRSSRSRCRAPRPVKARRGSTSSRSTCRSSAPAARGEAGRRRCAQARSPAPSRGAGPRLAGAGRRQGRQGMTLDDLRRLNLREVGNWPLAPKIGILALIFLVIVAAGALLRLEGPVRGTRTGPRSRRQQLRAQYNDKKNKAINSTSTASSCAEIEQSFGALLKQLPNKSEMDALLTDINQAGLGRGLAVRAVQARPRGEAAPSSTPSCRSASRSPATTTTWARSRATSRSCRASSR